MVLCDNPSYKYGWFHFSCVNLLSIYSRGSLVLPRLYIYIKVNDFLYHLYLPCT